MKGPPPAVADGGCSGCLVAAAGAFVAAMLLGMLAAGLFGLVAGIGRMAGRRMRMMRGGFVLSVFIVLCRLAVMARRVVVRIGGGGMML